MDTLSEFPRFTDGDATVMISSSHIYQLHSRTLQRLSGTFARLINEYPAARLTAAAKREGFTAYRFELRSTRVEGFGTFVRVRVADNGKLLRDNDPFSFPIAGTFGRANGQEKYWEWLFASFYNITPKFEDHNLATVLNSVMGLVDVAEAIEAVDQIREHVDLALLRQDQVLWKSIASNPKAWTELGCRVHSPTIFREGVIHLVGQWQEMTDNEKSELRPEIQNLVEEKWHELDIAKQAIDLRILGHYPAFLGRNCTDKPHRTSYSTDIYMWMAICFFRHWYAQAISAGRNRVAKDGGFEFYNALAQGGNAYLHHEDFKAFHQYFPMSGKACNVLEANMNVLKDEVKGFVKDIVKVRAHLENSDLQVTWLTCAVINKEDFPWEHAGGQHRTAEPMPLNGSSAVRSPLTPLDELNFDLNNFAAGHMAGSQDEEICNGALLNSTAPVDFSDASRIVPEP